MEISPLSLQSYAESNGKIGMIASHTELAPRQGGANGFQCCISNILTGMNLY